MICNNCKNQFNDGLTACPVCGAAATPAQPAPQQTPFQVPAGVDFSQPPAPKKKKNKALTIILAIFFALVVIGGIGSFISENKEATYVFRQEESDASFDMTFDYILDCKGDHIEKMTWEIDYDYIDMYAEYIEDIEDSIVTDFENDYGDYSFIDISASSEGTHVYVTIVFNDVEENIDDFIELDLIDGEADYLSYSKTKKSLEEDGAVLIEE